MNRTLILLLCLAPAALPQEKTMTCDEESRRDNRGQYCEIRETAIPASALDVDAGTNGGISVKGGSRSDILVRAKVQTYRDDETASRQAAAQIRVETAGGRVRASGPSETGHHG